MSDPRRDAIEQNGVQSRLIRALLRAARRSAASLRRIVVAAVRELCELVQLQHSESTSR